MNTKKKPSSDPQKLLSWLEEHADDGKLERDGILVSVVADDRVEFCGHVHERDYNRALLLSAPWGFKKSGIGEFGIAAILRQYPNEVGGLLDLSKIPTHAKDDKDSRFFRCNISKGTLEILQRFCRAHKLNRSQLATLVLQHFNSDPAILRAYDEWENQWHMPPDTVRKAVYDFFRRDGASRRYRLAKAGDPEAGAEKLT